MNTKKMAAPIIVLMLVAAIFPAMVLADEPMPRMAFAHDPANPEGLYINNDGINGTVKIYGEDDIGPKGIYSWYTDPFNPAVIEKDSLTFDPAILQYSAALPMHSDENLDMKKYLRLWYEPEHVYEGLLPAYTLRNHTYPTIELESTYMLIDRQNKLPTTAPAMMTEFAFPLEGHAPWGPNGDQIGLDTIIADQDADGINDLVKLVKVDGATAAYNKTTEGTIAIEKQFRLIGTPINTPVVQFLDHSIMLRAVYIDPENSDRHYAVVDVSYLGNDAPADTRTVVLGKDYSDGTTPSPVGIGYFDRHNNMFGSPSHTDTTWYAKLDFFLTEEVPIVARITVGKELAAGDTFYVDGMRYDVPAIEVIDTDGDSAADEFKYITLRTPIPKCMPIDAPGAVMDESIVSSQSITQVCRNDLMPVDPPFNGLHDIVDDTDVALWMPTRNAGVWPTGPFPEGERYLTMQEPPQAWINNFGAVKIDGDGDGIWIAYDVDERIVPAPQLMFQYVEETYEPRYSSDLLEILHETFPAGAAPIESWQKYVLRTMPDQYTEFELPVQPDVATPALTLTGDYIVTTSFYAPNSIGTEHNIFDAEGVHISTPECPCDLNGDGFVNNGDVLVIVANWGPCPT